MPTAVRRRLLGRYYALLALGYTPLEAANLLGLEEKLPPLGWTQRQVMRLIFLQWLYERRDPWEL